jgi:hypothetical protein
MCAWVKTVTEPLTPPAVAVTTAVPMGPAVQMVGVVVEFHLPAQMAPFVLTSTIAVLLLDQVGVRLVIVPPLESVIVAVRVANRPTSSEGFEGVTVILAAVGVVGFLLSLPHPASRPARIAKATTA